MSLVPLPIDGYVSAIRDRLKHGRAVVVSAAPGAGKTTRVPAALLDAGPVILLQPRRVAARAAARRIGEERGWTIGDEVGWQIRFERNFTAKTRLLVVTEGILTARFQQDPLLSDFATIVLDEFHERSIHADLGLALARQAWLARQDLRIVVMSATLDTAAVAAFLGGCPVVDVPGSAHPLTTEYSPGESVADAVPRVLRRTEGQVLCFLAGVREIERARSDLDGFASAQGIEVTPLHGSLGAEVQDAAIRPGVRRRVILATNIAETSLTVAGVSAVVDSGLQKVARYDAERGIDSLTIERVAQDSADQRAGRAARLGPGIVIRLWDARDRLRPSGEPDISRVDLAAPLLDLIAWGAQPRSFEWFEQPSAERIENALELLARLNAIEGETAVRLTEMGRQIQRIPLHPRLARILVDGRGAFAAAAACALLSEPAGVGTAGPAPTTTCDLLPKIDRLEQQPSHVTRVARELHLLANRVLGHSQPALLSDEALRHALFSGYSDRLGKRRAARSDRVALASGHGASLSRESGVRDGEYLVALDVVAGERDGIGEARIRLASLVERDWISPTSVEIEHRVDSEGRVRAARVSRYGALTLAETPIAPDPVLSAKLLAETWLAREHDEKTGRLLLRLRFADLDVDLLPLVERAAASAACVDDIDIEAELPQDIASAVNRQAPVRLPVPSGRSAALLYADDGSVSASVKLQELFGLSDTPRLGPRKVPVTFHLLAPNGRPVQTTRDLHSFWQRTYPEVRRELRGRYPRHPWPEDPWAALPTHRAK